MANLGIGDQAQVLAFAAQQVMPLRRIQGVFTPAVNQAFILAIGQLVPDRPALQIERRIIAGVVEFDELEIVVAIDPGSSCRPPEKSGAEQLPRVSVTETAFFLSSLALRLLVFAVDCLYGKKVSDRKKMKQGLGKWALWCERPVRRRAAHSGRCGCVARSVYSYGSCRFGFLERNCVRIEIKC